MKKSVVGLGLVESHIVQPILGPEIIYIENPNADDLAEASGAIVRASYTFDRSIFNQMKSLKVIARTGVGVDLVNLDEADKRKIPVVITPGSNTTAVAEGTFAHILALSKRIQPLTKLVQENRWDERARYTVGDLAGKVLGVIGYGRIGSKVAGIAEAFGMSVIAYDPLTEVPPRISGDLQSIFRESNYISLHIPYTLENKDIINHASIEQMKDGVILINCSRGGLINLHDTLVALNSGKVAGLGLDSFDREPPEFHPIFNHENVTLTPHVMGLSQSSTLATYQDAAQGVRDVLEGKAPKAIANLRDR